MRRFLSDRTILSNEKEKADLIWEANKFVLDTAAKSFDESLLYRKIREEVTALYIEFIFREDLMQKIHNQYRYLSYTSLENMYESRA